MEALLKPLDSNQELYEYLKRLQLTLERRGAFGLLEILGPAFGGAASNGTEFLGETRIALRKIRDAGVLDPPELDELCEVLTVVDDAMRRR